MRLGRETHLESTWWKARSMLPTVRYCAVDAGAAGGPNCDTDRKGFTEVASVL